MKKLFPAMLLLLSALLLSGCVGFVDGEYRSEQAHPRQYELVEGTDALRAGNYAGLKSALLYFVSGMETGGSVHLYNYEGDVQTGLAEARAAIMKEDALGAYAVDDIVFEINRIVAYYEVNVTISYKRSAEEVESIVTVSDRTEANEVVKAAMLAREDRVTVKISYFNTWEEGLESYAGSVYYENPGAAFLMPDISYSVYPEGENQRIVDISFKYSADKKTTEYYRDALERVSKSLAYELELDGLSDSPMEQTRAVYRIYEYLTEHVEYDDEASEKMADGERTSKTMSYTAYGALVNGRAVGEGTALAFKLLCGAAGIKCDVVLGRLGAYDHAWNIVKLGSAHMHIDASREYGEGFLLGDEDISSAYRWNSDVYPECAAVAKYQSVLPSADAEPPYVPPAETPDTPTEAEPPPEEPPAETPAETPAEENEPEIIL